VPVLQNLNNVDHFELPPCHLGTLAHSVSKGVYRNKEPGGWDPLVPRWDQGITATTR
jgi:hypothetical protein